MALTFRHFQDEEDGWRIREFLRRVTLVNDLHLSCWDVSCWDYWRWHVARNCFPELSIAGTTLLWETETGEIAAVLNQDSTVCAVPTSNVTWAGPSMTFIRTW